MLIMLKTASTYMVVLKDLFHIQRNVHTLGTEMFALGKKQLEIIKIFDPSLLPKKL